MSPITRLHSWWRRQSQEKPKWTDKVVALLTFAIVFVGILQTLIFIKQWQEMHSGGADTHDLALAAKAQADEAKVQAEQAKIEAQDATESAAYMKQLAEQTLAEAKATNKLATETAKSADYAGRLAGTSASELKVAEQTAHNDQRAWVGVQNIQLAVYKVGQPVKVNINLSNVGKSPALDVNYSVTLSILDKDETPPFAIDVVRPALTAIAPSTIAIAPIAPQGSYQITAEFPRLLNEYTKDLIDHHTDLVWAWGTVKYFDIFEQTHETQFCAFTLHLIEAQDAPTEGMALSSCPNKHNDMN